MGDDLHGPCVQRVEAERSRQSGAEQRVEARRGYVGRATARRRSGGGGCGLDMEEEEEEEELEKQESG